jgi:phthalate 4,5-cis-dihydrodiol dehydrogenase
VDTIRLAVIGAGNQCTTMLMPGLHMVPAFDLVAACDLKRELAERNARNFGASAVYTDAAEMLRQEDPDAVIVVGPPQMHEDVGIQVLEAGAHLWIEKPSSPTIAGAKRLADAAAKAGKLGQVGHMMRHATPIKIAWELAHAPEFGKILSVESRYTTGQSCAFPPSCGWGEPDEDWSYMLNQGGHPIDLLRHFMGDIVRVAAFRSHGAGCTKVYQVAVESADGKAGFLNLQDSFKGWTSGLEIVGDQQGIVTVEDLGRVQYRHGEHRVPSQGGFWPIAGNAGYVWEPHHMLTHGQRAGYGNQFEHFAACIRENRQPMPSLHDAWRNLVVAEAVIEACRTKEVVQVPSGDN